MKQFEKWNSKQERIVPSDTGRLYTLVDYERKHAWQAALKWVLDGPLKEHIRHRINEELEGN